MIFLKNLNASQLCAVQQEPSELLIFAGPGSGKTRVLTSRIASFVLERDPTSLDQARSILAFLPVKLFLPL